MSVQMIDCVREGGQEALIYQEGIWQNRIATFMQNDGNKNVRNEMRRTPQDIVKMEDDLQKKMEDDFNFKAVLLRLFNNKNLKNKWF
jgi:hypothetical protein